MKKALSTIAAFMLLGAFATNVWAYDGSTVAPSGQTIYYNYNSSSQTITITYPNTADAPWWNYTMPTGDLVIPDSIEHNGVNYPVTAIDNRAFYGCMNITSVIIGNNVTSIGGSAFHNCRNMTYTNFGGSVTTIGSNAFALCRSLSSIDIPNSVTSIDSYAFSDCYGLDTVNIGSSVTSIGNYAFWNCTTLTCIYMPDSVTTIGEDAFYNCPSLTLVVVGSGLTYVGGGAFYMCNNLQEMYIDNPIPPTLGGNNVFSFHVNPDTTYLHVPCGASSAYQSAAQWNAFTVLEDFEYSFSASSADTTNGTVQIIQLPNCSNYQAVVQANANDGFHFDHWNNGSTDNPLTFTVTSDTSIVAYFVSGVDSTESIDGVDMLNAKVYSNKGQIVVEGADDKMVTFYDISGRCLATKQDYGTAIRFDVPATGTYMIKIGNHAARKVVVMW